MRVITFSPIGSKVFCGSDLSHKYKINLASGKHSSVPCLVSGPYPPQTKSEPLVSGKGRTGHGNASESSPDESTVQPGL